MKKWFLKTSKLLLKHKYDFGLKKKILISKNKKTKKTKFLTIINLNNKIIEKAILNCIEPILEGN